MCCTIPNWSEPDTDIVRTKYIKNPGLGLGQQGYASEVGSNSDSVSNLEYVLVINAMLSVVREGFTYNFSAAEFVSEKNRF